jgi:hypothetical protein
MLVATTLLAPVVVDIPASATLYRAFGILSVLEAIIPVHLELQAPLAWLEPTVFSPET